MVPNPDDPDQVVAAVKGSAASNIALWVFCIAGALVVVALGKVARFLGVLGFWAYLAVAIFMALSAALAVVFGVMDLLGMTARSKYDIAKLWEARAVKVAEALGFALLTWLLHRQFY